jgi:RNA polymerase sigma-70 factor, ECF subfamily
VIKLFFRGSARGNDLDRFERLIQPELEALFRTACRLTGQRADAEDLVHDTCIKAFQAAGGDAFDTIGNVRAWLFRVLMNTYLDQHRRRRRSPERQSTAWSEATDAKIVELVVSPEPQPDAQLEHKQFALAAESAIAELPPDVKAVVILFFVEELTYQEIADVLACPVGTVMSRLWRGRRFLRKRLDAFAPSGALGDKSGVRKVGAKDWE